MSAAAPAPLMDRQGRHWSNTLGIVLIVAGVLCILLPLIAGVAIAALLGWLLLLAGVAHLAYAWGSRGAGSSVWQVLIGIVYVLIAFYLIFHPAQGLATLTFFLAIYLVVEGVFQLVMYFRLRRTHRATWFLFDGLITLLLGLLIWTHWPSSSVWAIGTILGIGLLTSGLTRFNFHPHRPRVHLPSSL